MILEELEKLNDKDLCDCEEESKLEVTVYNTPPDSGTLTDENEMNILAMNKLLKFLNSSI